MLEEKIIYELDNVYKNIFSLKIFMGRGYSSIAPVHAWQAGGSELIPSTRKRKIFMALV